MPDPQLVESARLGASQALAQQLPPERLAYNLRDLSEAVGIPKRTLHDALSRGEFHAVKRCGRWMVTRSEVLRWLTGET